NLTRTGPARRGCRAGREAGRERRSGPMSQPSASRRRIRFAVLLIIVAAAGSWLAVRAGLGRASTPPYLDPTLPADVRAADLVSRMTVEEKISQLTNEAAAIPRLGVPEYEWWNECLHGVARAGAATVFPQA